MMTLSIPLWLPQKSRVETAGPGPRAGDAEREQGAGRFGAEGSRESQPEDRSYRFSSTPTRHQHCPPNVTGGLQRQ